MAGAAHAAPKEGYESLNQAGRLLARRRLRRAQQALGERETALLAAAVYPGLGRQRPYYTVNQAPEGKGSEIFTLWDGKPHRAGQGPA